MTPFKDDGQSKKLAKKIYNKKHQRECSIAKNAFGVWLLHLTLFHYLT